MAFQVGAFQTSFQQQAQAAVDVRGGHFYGPTKEEWERYLKRFHELQRERFAARAARNGIRAELREQMFPKPPPKVRIQTDTVTPLVTKETRLPTPKYDPQVELRLKIAELLLDLRKRTKAEKKRRKRRRDEEALMALL